MLNKIIYENHNGKKFTTGENGIYLNDNNLQDYEWDYSDDGWRVFGFKKTVMERTLPLVVVANDDEEGIYIKNMLAEIAEEDVTASTPGKIWINGCYLKGFIVKSQKSRYNKYKKVMHDTLTFVPSYPYWIKEELIQCFPVDMEKPEKEGYPYSYPLSYAYADVGVKTYNLDHYADCNYTMKIYGPCRNPKIIINNYPLQIFTDVMDGEYLEINSVENVEKSVIKHLRNGALQNCYNSRQFEPSIFTKIQPGMLTINWSGSFGFDLTILKERSEPIWI